MTAGTQLEIDWFPYEIEAVGAQLRIIIDPSKFIGYIDKLQTIEWIIDKDFGIIELQKKISPTLYQVERFDLSVVTGLIYHHDIFHGQAEFHLEFLLERKKRITILTGTQEWCEQLGGIIGDFLELPVKYERKTGLISFSLLFAIVLMPVIIIFFKETFLFGLLWLSCNLIILVPLLIIYYFINYKSKKPSYIEDSRQFINTLHRKCHYEVHLAKDKIIDTCSVCKLSVFASEELFECPICHRKAHLPHFLEWLKIKGYCPHCRTNFNSLEGVKKIENLNVDSNSKLDKMQMDRTIIESPQFIKEAKKILKSIQGKEVSYAKVTKIIGWLVIFSTVIGTISLCLIDLRLFLTGLLCLFGFLISLGLLFYYFSVYLKIY